MLGRPFLIFSQPTSDTTKVSINETESSLFHCPDETSWGTQILGSFILFLVYFVFIFPRNIQYHPLTAKFSFDPKCVWYIYLSNIHIWSGVSYWVGFIHLAWCWLCLKITSLKFFDCQTLSLRWQIFWKSHMLSLSFFKTNIPQIFLKYSSWQIFWKSHMLSPIFLLTFMLAPGVTRMSPLAFCWRQNYEKSLRILRQI